MSRITKCSYIRNGKKTYGLDTNYNFYCGLGLSVQAEATQKLGKLEDIEDELGIDLITKDRIEQAGVCYWKDKDKKIHILFIKETERIGADVENIDGKKWFLYYKDYGKTWSLVKEDLTREELENGKTS